MVFKKGVDGEIKKKIEEILKNPPSYKEMTTDLRMGNVLIRQRSGDLSLLKSIDKNLLERIWKSYKITSLINQNTQKLKKMGVAPRFVQKQIKSFSRQFFQEVDKTLTNPIEGTFRGGFLELEVFNKQGGVVN